MDTDLNEEEKKVICNALTTYLKDLRGEIVKTEKHEMKADLHREEEIINKFIESC